MLRENPRFNLPPLPRSPAEDVLQGMQQLQPEIDELREASQRLYAQFVPEADAPFEERSLPHVFAYRSWVQFFSVRASAELTINQENEAFKDCYVIQRFADSLENDRTLVSAMIRVAITGVNSHTFWEGLMKNKWSVAQLEQFQKLFQKIDLIGSVDRSMREGERNSINAMVEKYSMKQINDIFRFGDRRGKSFGERFVELCSRAVPRGWIYQNQLLYTQMMQAATESCDVAGQQVFPTKINGFVVEIESVIQRRSPFKYLAAVAIPNHVRAMRTCARNQTTVNQAMLACALERYRHANGQFPATLEMLVPKFADKLPHDLIGGGPLHYRLTADGYVLYSIGWNQKDDDGVVVRTAKGDADIEKGDWVWAYPVEK
jgi:hypothetical protein